MFKYWKVGNDGHYYYVYNESIEEVKEEFDIQDPNFKFIEESEWTAENYTEILSNANTIMSWKMLIIIVGQNYHIQF